MKPSLLLGTLALTLSAAFAASAQNAPPPAPPAPPPPMTAGDPAHAPKDFATRKADILRHLDRRVAEATAARDCVSAANAPADLKNCRRQDPHGHHHRPAPADAPR